jgi:Zn-dependent M28 family amino/carboxypeptidase
VGGHYDSVPDCPAANDNGTGVAAVLEIARLAASAGRPDPKPVGDGVGSPFTRRPERTLRLVAFVNEEPPFFHTELMGSLVYARRCRARGENVVGMISLETIGCYSDRPGSQAYPLPPPLDKLFPGIGNFIAFVSDLGALGYVRHWVGSFRRLAKFPSEGAAAPELITGVGWSDHWSFRQVGYPALMITDTAPFRYPHYHTRDDTVDKIDFERTARVVAGVARVTAEDGGADGAES